MRKVTRQILQSFGVNGPLEVRHFWLVPLRSSIRGEAFRLLRIRVSETARQRPPGSRSGLGCQ